MSPMRDLKEARVKIPTETKVNLHKAEGEDEVPLTTEVQNPFRTLPR